MELNRKYFIPPECSDRTLRALHTKIFNRLPSREVCTEIAIDEYYRGPDDILSIERVYQEKQLVNNELKGKPTKIRFKRETTNAITFVDFGYTSPIDLRKVLEFLNYSYLGILTQIRTGFLLRGELIELPIVLNETREFGCFIEIGETVGAIEEIKYLLNKLAENLPVSDIVPIDETYSELLLRVKTKRSNG